MREGDRGCCTAGIMLSSFYEVSPPGLNDLAAAKEDEGEDSNTHLLPAAACRDDAAMSKSMLSLARYMLCFGYRRLPRLDSL